MRAAGWRATGLMLLAMTALGVLAWPLSVTARALGPARSPALYVANTTVHITSDGDPEVLGEVINDTPFTAAGISLAINYYDSDGADLFGTLYIGLGQLEIPPGASAPFQARTHVILPTFSRFFVAMNYFVTTEPVLLHDFDAQLDASQRIGSALAVNGTVTNRSGVATAPQSVHVMVGFYDDGGGLVGLAGALVEAALAPDELAPWNTMVLDAPRSYARYQFWVEARPAP